MASLGSGMWCGEVRHGLPGEQDVVLRSKARPPWGAGCGAGKQGMASLGSGMLHWEVRHGFHGVTNAKDTVPAACAG